MIQDGILNSEEKKDGTINDVRAIEESNEKSNLDLYLTLYIMMKSKLIEGLFK